MNTVYAPSGAIHDVIIAGAAQEGFIVNDLVANHFVGRRREPHGHQHLIPNMQTGRSCLTLLPLLLSLFHLPLRRAKVTNLIEIADSDDTDVGEQEQKLPMLFSQLQRKRIKTLTRFSSSNHPMKGQGRGRRPLPRTY
jgi:hypothetical protein